MVLVALLVANRQQTMEAVIRRLFSGSGKRISIVDTSKIHDLKTHLQLLDESGTDVAFVRVWDHGVEAQMCTGLFFDVVVYDNMAAEEMRCREISKNLHPKTMIVSNGDDAVLPAFAEGVKACVITYGLGQKSCVFPSCIDVGQDLRFNACIQRKFTTLDGKEVEEGEIVVELDGGNINIYDALAAVVLRVLLD